MRAFVLYLNDKKLCTAGVGDQGVLTAIVDWVRRKGPRTLSRRSNSVEEELGVSLEGLITSTSEHVRWRRQRLDVGDEVRIRIVETESVEKPAHREKRDRRRELRQQKTYVREMAKKFGWTIKPSR